MLALPSCLTLITRVLRVLLKIAQECHQHERHLVYGELGGDPEGALLLIAMGYRSLSMNYIIN